MGGKELGTQGASQDKLIDSDLKLLWLGEEHVAFQGLEIALQCTKTSLQERPSSRQVCDLLLNVLNHKMVDFDKLNIYFYSKQRCPSLCFIWVWALVVGSYL